MKLSRRLFRLLEWFGKMIKLFFTLSLFVFLVFPTDVLAKPTSFVSVVNPIRGADFWQDSNQGPQTVVTNQKEILKEFGVSASWLVRFDAFGDSRIIEILNSLPAHEKGLFLEVTPSWTSYADVFYHQSQNWHNAASAFLTGYETWEREKLIDAAFEKFKNVFGYFPTSVGAWWIDSYSLDYMQKKYKITAALVVSDQYTTDNYQIWGQYFSTPYYPTKKNVLHPAQSVENKIPIVMMQWAARDPINAYGDRVEESTYSVQANDYIDYHNLDTNYFSSLIDIYTKQQFNKFGHVVVGLENSYSWDKYGLEYRKQVEALVEKTKKGQFQIISMRDFAAWYQKSFPDLSPEHLIVADDPLGGDEKVVWFMNPYYRAGWFFNKEASVFRDIRQYVEGEEELCFQKRCDEVNFATFATRVLDEVTFGHKLVVDEGRISQFNLKEVGEKYVISYKNEAGNERVIEFLPRDIGIDDKISTIDGIILDTTKNSLEIKKEKLRFDRGPFGRSFLSVITKTFLFLGFLILGCFVPGWILISRVLPKETVLQKGVLSLILGFTLATLLFYILSLLNLKQAIFIYLLINLLVLIKISRSKKFDLDRFNLLSFGLIVLGTVFQNIPTFKSGLNFPYGLGFWGPNTHDGIWHISLINQLTKAVPPPNPIFAGEVLKNYHYFYDLLVAATNYVSGIPILDLVFRFYPITFSVLLGVGTYSLLKYSFKIKEKLAVLFSIYLVYFAGSFGWVVEYIKLRHLGGESAFWANQSISFNLNPPFAISLLFVISILLLLPNLKSKLSVVLISLLAGSLVAFKAYGAILILVSLIIVGIFKRDIHYILVFIFSALLSAFLLLSDFSIGQKLFIFSPFWFIHSMIDSPDRVGWVRLSLARVAGLEQGNWFKFLAAETVSFLIFLIGNLGTRVFALAPLLKIKNIVRRADYLFIFVFSFLAFTIPILFIQAGNPWNTIQFLYYFLYISAILGGVVFAKFVLKLPKAIAIIATTAFIAVTPINSWTTASGYLGYNPHAYITKAELEALKFLASQEDGIVLTVPYDAKLKSKIEEPWPILVYDSTAYVAAISGKQTYVADEPQNQILLTDYKKRVVASKDFFLRSENQKALLLENNIKYIYLPKIYIFSIGELSGVVNIFENDEVLIYKVE